MGVGGGEVGVGSAVGPEGSGVLVGGAGVGVAAVPQATAITSNTAHNGKNRISSFIKWPIVTVISSFHQLRALQDGNLYPQRRCNAIGALKLLVEYLPWPIIAVRDKCYSQPSLKILAYCLLCVKEQ